MATAPSHAHRAVTAAQFLQFPDDFPLHSELINGQVVVSEPTLHHQRVRDFIHRRIDTWRDAGANRGETFSPIDIPIDERNVFAPDVSWYSDDRRPPRDAVRAEVAPDLGVEVRSPSTWRYDLSMKYWGYQKAGVREVWLVDTASRTVIVHRRSSGEATTFDESLDIGEGELLTSRLLPDFALDVRELSDR